MGVAEAPFMEVLLVMIEVAEVAQEEGDSVQGSVPV